LRLADQRPLGTENRAHFLGVAARLMRHILVDYARSHRTTKGGAASKVALDDALTDLAKVNEQRSRIVELRLFGGLTTEEAAEALGISRTTAKCDWNVANAWLTRRTKRGSRGSTGAVGQTKEIVRVALGREPSERSAFLDTACSRDDALRAEADSLLSAHAEASGLSESTFAPGDPRTISRRTEG